MERKDYLVVVAEVSKYKTLDDFKEGLSLVGLEIPNYGMKFGFINKKGEEVIKCEYDVAYPFHGGFALVKKDNRWFFIDKKGLSLINYGNIYSDDNYKFEQARDFSNGLAAVMKNGRWGFLKAFYTKDSYYGHLTSVSNIDIPFMYDSVSDFKEGFAFVELDGKISCINKKNQELFTLPPEYVLAYPFSDTLARVKTYDNRYGFFNQEGKEVIKPTFNLASDFKYGYAIIDTDLGTTLINKKGEKIHPETKEFSIVSIRKASDETIFLVVNYGHNQLGLVDLDFNKITNRKFKAVYENQDGFLRVKNQDENYEIIDSRGNTKKILEKIGEISEGKAPILCENSKMGYFDINDDEYFSNRYDHVNPFHEGVGKVENLSHQFFIDENGKRLDIKRTKREILELDTSKGFPDFIQKAYVLEYKSVFKENDDVKEIVKVRDSYSEYLKEVSLIEERLNTLSQEEKRLCKKM